MENTKLNKGFGIVTIMILIAALSRLLPHPPNFTAVTGMALFGAAYLPKKHLALIVPLLALWISNLILDNVFFAQWYPGFMWLSQPWVFVGFILIVFLGFGMLKKITFGRLAGASIISSLLFFLVTNFGVWLGSPTWPQSLEGLMACYWFAMPFLSNSGAEHFYLINTVVGDLFFTGVLFGGYELIKANYPSLAIKRSVG